MPHREHILQDAQKIACYLKEHPGTSLKDVAKAFDIDYPNLRSRYHIAVEQGFIEKRKFRRGLKGPCLEQIIKVANCYLQTGSSYVAGQAMGISGVTVRNYVKKAVELGEITEEQIKSMKAQHKPPVRISTNEPARWAYFIDLAHNIMDYNRQTRLWLLEKHFPGKKHYNKNAKSYRYEKRCLDELVKNHGLSGEDAELIRQLITRLKQFPLTLNQLKGFSKDAVQGMTNNLLAFKYGLAQKNGTTPSAHAVKCLRYAMELGLLDQNAYEAKVVYNLHQRNMQ